MMLVGIQGHETYTRGLEHHARACSQMTVSLITSSRCINCSTVDLPLTQLSEFQAMDDA